MPEREPARTPEDLTRLFVERANAGDVDGLVELYEPDAVMAYPPGSQTVGHAAIRDLFTQMLANRPHFEPEPPLPTVRMGDLALTSTPPKDDAGAQRAARRSHRNGRVARRPVRLAV
jgi:ketosteroid isomerase-like protein